MIIIFECRIEIAVVAVSEHCGNVFNTEVCSFQKRRCTLHSLFQHNLGKRFSRFLADISQNVIRMIGKMLSDITKSYGVKVFADILYDFLG